MPAPKPDSRSPFIRILSTYSGGAWVLAILALFVVASQACNLTNRAFELQATVSALNALQTSLAATSAVLGTPPAVLLVPPTLIVAPTIQPTQSAAATAEPTEADVQSTPISGSDDRLMKSARILLFEDMSASRQVRLVKEALDRTDYFYLDVGSAKGWFKNQLLSGQEWDLVIASGEAERDFGGEFFEYLDAHVASGGSAIIETWDLDSAPEGRARSLLDRCGLKVQSDWFEPELRVFYWTDASHTLFNRPNSLTDGLRNAPALWSGDVGDLLELDPASADRGQIVASTNPEWTSDHGLVVDCMDGRLILQTFRSHEYHHDDVVALWQNYIDYALRGHFEHTGQTAPPVAQTAAAAAPTAVINHSATPGPGYSFPFACGSVLTARLLQAPRLQADLFEHHAVGSYLILRLEVVNTGPNPIQIWDEDYSVNATLFDKPVSYSLNRPASGYLYIENPTELYQDLIEPGETWRTSLAFDVDPAASDWDFILRPGSEFNETACEVHISLTR